MTTYTLVSKQLSSGACFLFAPKVPLSRFPWQQSTSEASQKRKSQNVPQSCRPPLCSLIWLLAVSQESLVSSAGVRCCRSCRFWLFSKSGFQVLQFHVEHCSKAATQDPVLAWGWDLWCHWQLGSSVIEDAHGTLMVTMATWGSTWIFSRGVRLHLQKLRDLMGAPLMGGYWCRANKITLDDSSRAFRMFWSAFWVWMLGCRFAHRLH